ncbi:hypothetical protein BO71DRAFT_90611 [Aspergillus ellipticus CBS 707.79]|uniref:Uncharacterized protein n=1 Tax=Aspergillus ellipticus CBS 707.79 TaxID=1448320 RepID=A0A319DPV0_9EURO|nr:hypothetical protein BO71DRAFT_90611 [Aspergillus ellipticus CBS 707.79]
MLLHKATLPPCCYLLPCCSPKEGQSGLAAFGPVARRGLTLTPCPSLQRLHTVAALGLDLHDKELRTALVRRAVWVSPSPKNSPATTTEITRWVIFFFICGIGGRCISMAFD